MIAGLAAVKKSSTGLHGLIEILAKKLAPLKDYLLDGKMNYTIKMMISVMGSFSEIENEIRKERQMEGIEIAKSLGKYQNRKQRGKESKLSFLQKHKQAVDLLEQGYKGSHVSKICNLNKNTVSKIKRHLNPQIQTVLQ